MIKPEHDKAIASAGIKLTRYLLGRVLSAMAFIGVLLALIGGFSLVAAVLASEYIPPAGQVAAEVSTMVKYDSTAGGFVITGSRAPFIGIGTFMVLVGVGLIMFKRYFQKSTHSFLNRFETPEDHVPQDAKVTRIKAGQDKL